MDDDPLTFRLGDLKPHNSLQVQCACGCITAFPFGSLQRKHRVRSDTLVYDLQFRLRCRQCRSRGPFRIGIVDERERVSSTVSERVIVGWEEPRVVCSR